MAEQPLQPNWEGPNVGLTHIVNWGLAQLQQDIIEFEAEYREEANKVLYRIAQRLSQHAQRRSPYLYGILHGAHRAELQNDAGVVFIDPNVWHPYLGGHPAVYGAEIHAGVRPNARPNPWFETTVQQDADRIVREEGSEILFATQRHFDQL